MKKNILLLPFLSIALLTNCGRKAAPLEFSVNDSSNQPLDPTVEVKFPQIKSEILGPYCLSCHSSVGTEINLKKWIVPGKPDNSIFFTSVENGSMPLNQKPLNTRSLELIRIYITQMVQTGGTTTGGTTTGGTTTGGTTTGGTTTGGTTTGGTTTGGTTTGGTTTGGTTTGGTTTGGTTTGGISYAEIKSTVLTPYRCLNCHSVGTETSLAKWMSKSSPSSSKFYTTMKDGSMPQGGPRASAEIQVFVLQYIKDWAKR